MNIKHLKVFHYIVVQLLDSDVLATGFGLTIPDLLAMKAELERLMEREEYEKADFRSVGTAVNTVEMARKGHKGTVTQHKTARNE